MEQQKGRSKGGPNLGPPPSRDFSWSMHVKNFASGFKTSRLKTSPFPGAGHVLQRRSQARLPSLHAVTTPSTTVASAAHDHASNSHTGDQEGHNRDSPETQDAVRLDAVEEEMSSVTESNKSPTPGLPQDRNAVASSSSQKPVDTTGPDSHDEQHPDLIEPVEPTSDTNLSLELKQASDSKKVKEPDRDLTSTVTSVEDAALVSFRAAQRREWVKEHVWQILTHKLRGAERISGGIVVETESQNSQQMVVVKCYGPAMAKAREIRKLLEKTNHKLASQGFVLSVREESRPGTDLHFLAEPSVSDAARPEQQLHTNTSGAPRPMSSHRVSTTDAHDTYDVYDVDSTITTRLTTNGDHRAAGRFANTPYWNALSVPVDCLLPRASENVTNTLCGALIRMTSWKTPREPQSRVWTCGGIVHVNGIPYALTTAHPFVLRGAGKDQVDVEVEETKSSASDFVLPTYDEINSKAHGQIDGTQNWQTLGQVYKHALSNGNQVPSNYDWLLIDIARGHHILPNILLDSGQDISLDPQLGNHNSMSIRTWRGSLQATVMPGFSFMILGESLFKARKFSVDRPMGESAATISMQFSVELIMMRCLVQGDSGSWVFKGEDVLGVVIAGSSEFGGEHYAYAISMTEVCRNISIGIGDASVHVPTPIENAITAHKLVNHGRDSADLAGLLFKQLIHEVAREGGSVTDIPSISRTGSDLDSLLHLACFCPLLQDPEYKLDWLTAILKFRMYHFRSFARVIRPGSGSLWPELCNYHELQNLRGLSRIIPLDGNEILQQIMSELGISPVPSMNHLQPVLRNLRRDYKLASMRSISSSAYNSIISGLPDLPKVLARLLYAASVRQFFVYCGPLADWLCHVSTHQVRLDITMLHRDTDAANWTPRRRANSRAQWPAFVIREDRRGDYDGQTQAQFSRYGDIVEHAELRDLVLRLLNR